MEKASKYKTQFRPAKWMHLLQKKDLDETPNKPVRKLENIKIFIIIYMWEKLKETVTIFKLAIGLTMIQILLRRFFSVTWNIDELSSSDWYNFKNKNYNALKSEYV